MWWATWRVAYGRGEWGWRLGGGGGGGWGGMRRRDGMEGGLGRILHFQLNALRDGLSGEHGGNSEGAVDSGADACRRDDVSVYHHARVLRFRAELRKQV